MKETPVHVDIECLWNPFTIIFKNKLWQTDFVSRATKCGCERRNQTAKHASVVVNETCPKCERRRHASSALIIRKGRTMVFYGPTSAFYVHRAIFHTVKSDVFYLNLQIAADNGIIIISLFCVSTGVVDSPCSTLALFLSFPSYWHQTNMIWFLFFIIVMMTWNIRVSAFKYRVFSGTPKIVFQASTLIMRELFIFSLFLLIGWIRTVGIHGSGRSVTRLRL